MIRLARAGNCGALGASGLAEAAPAVGTSKPASRINAAKPSIPRPVPIRPSICRRVSRRAGRCSSGFISINKNSLVANQQHLGQLFPGSQPLDGEHLVRTTILRGWKSLSPGVRGTSYPGLPSQRAVLTQKGFNQILANLALLPLNKS